jgi:cyclic beta-1,2-glucan synthetase
VIGKLPGWLGPTVRDASGRKKRNDISDDFALEDFRQFAPQSAGAGDSSAAGWPAGQFCQGSGVWISLFVLLTLAFPVYAHLTSGLLIHPEASPGPAISGVSGATFVRAPPSWFIEIVFIAHQSWLMVDAIVRTLYRKLVSRRYLLEWVTQARVEKSNKHDLRSFLRFMWPAEAICLAIVVLIIAAQASRRCLTRAGSGDVGVVSAKSLFMSVARRVQRHATLGAPDVRTARIVARRTWRFFETFVGDEDHWLPPDNFQEDPPVVAHRTSPTNIGLLLLSSWRRAILATSV